MAAIQLPTPEAFADLAGMLVGKRVRAKKIPALAAAAVKASATYVDASGSIAVVAISDLPFVASIGAALAMIPVPTVQEAIRTSKPNEMLVDNAYEVLNVGASLFNDAEGNVHVKVTKLVMAAPAADVAKRMAASKTRVDWELEIPGYPNGKISFVAVGAV